MRIFISSIADADYRAQRVIDITPKIWTQRLRTAVIATLTALIAVPILLTGSFIALGVLGIGMVVVSILVLKYWLRRKQAS
jgi:accessory gene regulator protein AgrB